MIKFRFMAPAAAAATLLAATGAQAATTISSTFDTGDEGWRYGGYASATRTAVTYDAATQSVRAAQGISGGGFVAPTAYLGDKSAYAGGQITFDLAVTSPIQVPGRPLVILQGAGQTIFAQWGESPGRDLETFTVALEAANFYVGGPAQMDGPVSAELFAAVLADLRMLLIYADWTVGIDRAQLDNVALSARPTAAVPEPAAWALMIGGFGLAGSALRRRRLLQTA